VELDANESGDEWDQEKHAYYRNIQHATRDIRKIIQDLEQVRSDELRKLLSCDTYRQYSIV
jgi:hypothetical protein